jgi:hypothetical protein
VISVGLLYPCIMQICSRSTCIFSSYEPWYDATGSLRETCYFLCSNSDGLHVRDCLGWLKNTDLITQPIPYQIGTMNQWGICFLWGGSVTEVRTHTTDVVTTENFKRTNTWPFRAWRVSVWRHRDWGEVLQVEECDVETEDHRTWRFVTCLHWPCIVII